MFVITHSVSAPCKGSVYLLQGALSKVDGARLCMKERHGTALTHRTQAASEDNTLSRTRGCDPCCVPVLKSVNATHMSDGENTEVYCSDLKPRQGEMFRYRGFFFLFFLFFYSCSVESFHHALGLLT